MCLVLIFDCGLVLSFGINSSIFAFCLITVYFSVLEKPVMFPSTGSNGFMKNWSCSVEGMVLQ